MQPSDYLVLWNGVNDGRDGDLLCVGSRVPEKSVAVFEARRLCRLVPAWQVVLDALGSTREDGLTLRLIAARTGLAKQQVNTALCVLRARERLASALVDPCARTSSHGTRCYWRAAEPVTL